ncbi:MAG: 6-carboxytetrahydropterin synthase [Planctomycetota bacterium]|jgi:6-pyruvoyltetrahydropterin/6-carboxytetrahydropterin synthase
MYELSRRVRIRLSPAQVRPQRSPSPPAGARDHDPVGVDAFYELEVKCLGRPDPTTGFVMNISEIDAAVRAHAEARLRDAMSRWIEGSRRSVGSVLNEVIETLQPRLGGTVASVRLWLSPYHWLLVEATTMDRVLISEQFEFSAAHRLHCPDLSDEQNRTVFGKCNNPSGHGHNYKLEAVVSVPLTEDGGAPGFAQLERLVDEHVIRRFDHKHLNLDTQEFARLIPSVEHIVRVCHDVLAGPVAEAGGRLERVTVWETDKTACTYPAGASPP